MCDDVIEVQCETPASDFSDQADEKREHGFVLDMVTHSKSI